MHTYKRIGVTAKDHLVDREHVLSAVFDVLKNTGATAFVDHALQKLSIYKDIPLLEDNNIDALLVVGGDGTILRSVRQFSYLNVPLITVNRGTVGFLAELTLDEVGDALPRIIAGAAIIEERSLISVEVVRSDAIVFHSFALNEAAISQGAIARLLDLRTTISGEPLATFHADGLIVATPTGSTAYSLAAGGPVVHPRLQAMILTPINPHSLTQKPVVIPGDGIIDIDVLKADNPFASAHVSLTLDGQVYEELHKDDRVRVKLHDSKVQFLRRREDTFFHTLRTKLHWGERLS